MLDWLARGRSANALGLLSLSLFVVLLPFPGGQRVESAVQICLGASIVLFALFCLRLWWIKPPSQRIWSGLAAVVTAPMFGHVLLALLERVFPGGQLGELAAHNTWIWLYALAAFPAFIVLCVVGYLRTRDLDHVGLLLAGCSPLGILVLAVAYGLWALTQLTPVP